MNSDLSNQLDTKIEAILIRLVKGRFGRVLDSQVNHMTAEVGIKLATQSILALIEEARMEGRIDSWYITTDFFSNNGEKVMGPFRSRELALEVRRLLENNPNHRTYAVDQLKANAAGKGG